MGAIIAGVIGAIGAGGSAYMSKEGAKDAGKYGADAAGQSSQVQWDMYDQQRSDMEPYAREGRNALGAMTGQTWGQAPVYDELGNRKTFTGEEALTDETGLKGHITLVNSKGESRPGYVVGLDGGEHWVPVNSPQFSDIQRAEISKAQGLRGKPATQEGFVPGGERKDYQADAKNALASYQNLDTGGMPDANFASGIDPMAGQMDVNTGLGKRPNLPENFKSNINSDIDFKVDMNALENDPITKWKRDQTAKGINKGLLARGKYDSRAGINALAQADMGVLADEVDRQYGRAVDEYGRSVDKYRRDVDAYGRDVDEYNRGYGRGMDLYNIGYNEGNTLYARGTDQADKAFTRNYGMKTDLYNRRIGQNDTLFDRNQAQQWNVFNALNSLGGQKYSQDLDLIKIGQGAAASTGAGALSTGQGISNSYTNAGNAQAQSALGQANANAAFMSGLGGMGNNVLANQYYMKQLQK